MSFISKRLEAKNKTFGFAMVIISASLWGMEGVLAQLCYGAGFNAPTLLFFRYFIMAIIFVLIAIFTHTPIFVPKGKRRVLLLMTSLHLLTSACLYVSFSLLPATLSILFLYAYPSFACLISRFWYRESLGPVRIISLLLSGAGLIFLYWTSLGAVSSLGILLALLSAFFQGININIVGREMPTINKISYNASLAIIVAIVFAILNFAAASWSFAYTQPAWMWMISLAVFSTAFANYFYVWGVSIVGAVDAAIAYLVEPVATAILSFLVFGYLLSQKQTGGALMILGAVALQQIFLRVKRKKAAACP